jgi:putative Holliday junction resolvase
MKLLGIDYGRRRIGLAITDEDGAGIRGLPTIDKNKTPDSIQEILSIIIKEKPGALVVGLPLDFLDNETDMSKEVRSFADELKGKSGLEIHFVDESFLSVRAQELLRFRKKKERRDKGSVDRLSACLILEQFRESHR